MFRSKGLVPYKRPYVRILLHYNTTPPNNQGLSCFLCIFVILHHKNKISVGGMGIPPTLHEEDVNNSQNFSVFHGLHGHTDLQITVAAAQLVNELLLRSALAQGQFIGQPVQAAKVGGLDAD